MVIRVSLRFTELTDDELSTFAKNVHANLTGNAAFPTPPISLAAMQTAMTDFFNKTAAALDGSKMDTAAKEAARQTLIGILRQQALYVEMQSGSDETILLSSGFDKRSTERASVPLEKPENVAVRNGGATELIAKVTPPVKNTSMYEIRAKAEGGTTWLESAFTGDSRNISITGLTPGVLYTIEVRALGGSTGHSDWSDQVMHRSL